MAAEVIPFPSEAQRTVLGLEREARRTIEQAKSVIAFSIAARVQRLEPDAQGHVLDLVDAMANADAQRRPS